MHVPIKARNDDHRPSRRPPFASNLWCASPHQPTHRSKSRGNVALVGNSTAFARRFGRGVERVLALPVPCYCRPTHRSKSRGNVALVRILRRLREALDAWWNESGVHSLCQFLGAQVRRQLTPWTSWWAISNFHLTSGPPTRPSKCIARPIVQKVAATSPRYEILLRLRDALDARWNEPVPVAPAVLLLYLSLRPPSICRLRADRRLRADCRSSPPRFAADNRLPVALAAFDPPPACRLSLRHALIRCR